MFEKILPFPKFSENIIKSLWYWFGLGALDHNDSPIYSCLELSLFLLKFSNCTLIVKKEYILLLSRRIDWHDFKIQI